MQSVAFPVQSEWVVLSDVLKVQTESRIGLYNLTPHIVDFVQRSRLGHGVVIVSSMHTTTAIFINEYQDALLRDIQAILEQLVREDQFYYHNSEDYSDCERKNATAHLRAMLLGHQVILPVHHGQLAIGTWQSVILAELDGPRTRTVHLQGLGVPLNGHR